MPPPAVTAVRFAQGRSFEEYLAYIASPANLARPNNLGVAPRSDFSALLRSWYQAAQLTPHQHLALKALAALPNGPAKVLLIIEDWSSDCRRELASIARLCATVGLELRIFNRDNAQGKEPGPTDAGDAAGNGDLMHQFLNHKNGAVYQSVPVAAFFGADMRYIYHFTEYAGIYQKDPFLARLRAPLAGEGEAQTAERTGKLFTDLQNSPLFQVWACAGVDEMITGLWEALVLPQP